MTKGAGFKMRVLLFFNIDPAELCEMDWEDDPFEWVQFKNEGIPHLRADEDDLDCYDIEDMGLDPNFYMGDGNNF